MRFRKYVATKCIPLCFIGLAAVLLFLFLLMQSANAAIILSPELSLALLTVLWLAVSYLVQRRRYEKLERVISELDEKYLLGEVLPKPQNEVEMVYYHIMKTVSRSAITAVEKAKLEKEEYREYVESWLHEIKTPLTACSLILENGGNTQKLRRELKRADNMTESILYYARTKSLEKDTIIRTFSVFDVIESSVKSQMALLIAAGIGIEVTGDFIVNSDDKALGFIINQLLINSGKYCKNCHITIAAKDNIITYEDNGIGIPSHELERITERGFTGTNGRRLGNSTGMGLYIVKELCKHLNITLSIASEEYTFTRFKLTFHSLTNL
ncbi:MAG TPA: sensor histidine kinase [Lachnospiraceae bacterium]|nr:sensor histidine kinase [Lachnospiraceae bacterium]